MPWSPEIIAKYSEAGDMMRHFSTIRSVVISFTLSVFFVIVGLVVTNIENTRFILSLLLVELFVFIWALLFYLYLSVSREVARQCLIAIEREKEVYPHRALETFKFSKDLKLDFYDKMYLLLGAGLHFFLYIYLIIFWITSSREMSLVLHKLFELVSP